MELRERFRGTGVAVVTPFSGDGKIDLPGFEKVINHIINGKCEYLVVLGTTGESATVSAQEKQEVFSFVNAINKGRVELVAGIGGNDTHDVLESFKKYDLTGYDAILSVAPYYNRPNQEGIFQHYKAIDLVTPLPVIMYNVPGRTGQNVTAETTLRIANECKNIFATKEASGNLDQIMQVIKYKPAEFMVISGDDALTLPLMALGAEGVISVVANAYPREYSDMVRLCMDGRYAEAQDLHYKYTDVIQAMFSEGSPSGVKMFLCEMGICGSHTRPPVWSVSSKHHQKIRELMKHLG